MAANGLAGRVSWAGALRAIARVDARRVRIEHAAPPHSWSGSWPALVSAHVPSLWFVLALSHRWQVPTHGLSQQKPSTQLPLPHNAPSVQGVPSCFFGLHSPLSWQCVRSRHIERRVIAALRQHRAGLLKSRRWMRMLLRCVPTSPC